ncbi:hypothetical protein BUI56_02870 [Lactococcus lactis subsp. lactis]|nr:Orf5 [Lactococcus phage bIL310]KAF0956032.1 hypothetical protein BUI56_02870 [Lactococcus lactis subsp. lactis]ONK31654.1 hypothetical protein BZO99_09165 [Lactococcus lactis subsp. lactis]
MFGINRLYNIFYNLYIKKPLQRVTLYLKVMTSQNHYTFILHFFVFGFKLRNRDMVVTSFICNYLRSHFTTLANRSKIPPIKLLWV